MVAFPHAMNDFEVPSTKTKVSNSSSCTTTPSSSPIYANISPPFDLVDIDVLFFLGQ